MTERKILWRPEFVDTRICPEPSDAVGAGPTTAPAPAGAGDAESLRAATVLRFMEQ